MNSVPERLRAVAARSSHVENVLRHQFCAAVAQAIWARDPFEAFQVLVAEVDDAGFDLVLSNGVFVRYVQLKQAHGSKSVPKVSVRESFVRMPGACVVLMSYSLDTLALGPCRYLGGQKPTEPIALPPGLAASRLPGRKDAAGQARRREHYRDMPIKYFSSPLPIDVLVERLLPPALAEVADIRAGIAEADADEFASDSEVGAVLKRHGAL